MAFYICTMCFHLKKICTNIKENNHGSNYVIMDRIPGKNLMKIEWENLPVGCEVSWIEQNKWLCVGFGFFVAHVCRRWWIFRGNLFVANKSMFIIFNALPKDRVTVIKMIKFSQLKNNYNTTITCAIFCAESSCMQVQYHLPRMCCVVALSSRKHSNRCRRQIFSIFRAVFAVALVCFILAGRKI